MSRKYHLLVFYVIPIFCAIGLIVCPVGAGKFGEWRSYGSDDSSTKFLPLDQINKGNIKNLRIAWRWNSPDNALVESNPDLWTMVNEATPLMIDRVIYTSTSFNQVAAIKAATGETIRVYDPKTYKDGTPATPDSCIAVYPIGSQALIDEFCLVPVTGISSRSKPKRENQYKDLERMVELI